MKSEARVAETRVAAGLVADALAHLGLSASPAPDAVNGSDDLVIDPDGAAVSLHLLRRALVDRAAAARMLASTAEGASLLVVGDRVTEDARSLLTQEGAGYYDLRGRLALRAQGLIIDVPTPPAPHVPAGGDPLRGKGAMEVATALLMSPGESLGVRELARRLGRAPSTVSAALRGLRAEGLVDDDARAQNPHLFWAVAQRWPSPPQLFLSRTPPAGKRESVTLHLELGLEDDRQTGWALTGTAAASALGAPIAVRSDQALEFYVPDVRVLRRATALLGETSSAQAAACSVTVAPVPAVCSRRLDPPQNPFEWFVAHPLFVGLDLAQDRGRGREILQDWTPTEWQRVW